MSKRHYKRLTAVGYWGKELAEHKPT